MIQRPALPTTGSIFPINDHSPLININTEEKSPSAIELIIHKIVTIAKNIWSTISSLFDCQTNELSKNTRKNILLAKENQRYFTVDPQRISGPTLSPITPRRRASSTEVTLKHSTDPILLDFGQLLEDFSEVFVHDCLFPEVISPHIFKWKKLLQFIIEQFPRSEEMNPIIDEINTVISKELEAEEVESLLEEINEMISDDPDEDRRKNLLEKMKNLKTINDYSSEKSQSIINGIQQTINQDYYHLRTGKLILSNLQLLSCAGFFKEIENTVTLNIKPISFQIIHRLCHLIEGVEFQKMFDEILDTIQSHSDAWVAANTKRIEAKKAIEESGNILQMKTQTAKEVETHRKAEDYMETVKNAGGEEDFIEKQFQFIFGEQETCHPVVKELIMTKNSSEKARINDKFYQQLSHSILSGILPQETLTLHDGSTTQVHGIDKVLQAITLSPEFEQIKDTCLKNLDETLDKANLQKRDELLRISFVEIAHKLVKMKIKSLGQQALEKLYKKEYLDKIAIRVFIPCVIEKMFRIWVRSTIEYDLEVLSPLFHRRITATQEQPMPIEELTLELYQHIKTKSKQFSFEKAGLDIEKFTLITNPLLDEIENHALLNLKNSTSTENEIREALKTYLKNSPVDQLNPVYGKLIMNFLFKIGHVGGSLVENIVRKFETDISQNASMVMEPVSKSFHLILSNLTEMTKETLLNPNKVYSLLFTDEIEKTPGEIEQSLSLLASLTHDMIYHALDSLDGGSILHYGYWATPPIEKIEELFSEIYENFLSRPNQNKSLILQVMEVGGKYFGKSATAASR